MAYDLSTVRFLTILDMSSIGFRVGLKFNQEVVGYYYTICTTVGSAEGRILQSRSLL